MKSLCLPGFIIATGLAVSVGAGTSFAATAPAPAKTSATFHSSNWQVECNNNGTALDCHTTNRITQMNGEQLASITFQPAAEGDGATAVLQLPLGIALSAPVQLAVGSNAPVTLVLNSCLTQGCFAAAKVPASFIARARQGKALIVSFGTPDGQRLAVSIALKGFELAFDRLSQ